MLGEPTFPVITLETLARFFFPSLPFNVDLQDVYAQTNLNA